MTMRIRFVASRSPVVRDKKIIGSVTEVAQQSTRSLAAAIANDLAFSAADNMFRNVKNEIAASFQKDAKQELTHLAALYRRHVIGAGAGKRRPSGMLSYALGPSDTGVGDDDNEVAIAESLPDWAPRSPRYLARKKRMGWSQTWFSARGDLAREMRADVLLSAYGPVRVSVVRNVEATNALGGTRVSGRFTGARLDTFGPNAGPAKSAAPADVAASHIRLQVATIRVFAMQQITPSMLPALATGNPATQNDDSASRGTRFIEPLRSVSPTLAYRLGRLSWQTGRYRPTLEPFLAWYLTRAIPNALALRIEQGAIRRARRLNVVRR